MRPARLIPLIVASALFMENMDGTVIATSLPAMAQDLDTDPINLKLAFTTYLISLTVFIPVSGWFADKFGAKDVFRAAILVFTLGSVACGFADSLEWLIAARALQGMGGAMMVPVGRLILLRSVPKNELVNALAYLTIPALVGPLIGPPLGGFITTYFHWRWIFWINIPVGLLGLVLVTALMPEIRVQNVPRLDMRGFVLSGLGLASLVFGTTVLGREILPFYGAPLLIGTGAFLLVAYIVYARKVPEPILDLKLLNYETFRSGVVGGSIFRIGAGALPFLLPLMLQIGFGLTPFQSGTLTCAAAAGALAMKFSAGRVIKAFGFRSVLLLNGIASSIALGAIGLFDPQMPFAVIVIILLIGGFVRSLQFTALNAISYADIASEAMGKATSLYGVAQQLSLATGVAVAAFMLEGARAWRGDPVLVTADFAFAFFAIAALSALSLLSFRRLDVHAGSSVSGRIGSRIAKPSTSDSQSPNYENVK